MRYSRGAPKRAGMVLWLAAAAAIPALVADVSANSGVSSALMTALLQVSTSTPPRPPASVQAVVVEEILEQTGSPTLITGGSSVTLETTDLFDVPPNLDEEQDVTYTASSSDPTVAIAEYRNPVVVTPVGPGVATITVVSQVGNNTPVTVSFGVTVAETVSVPALPLIGQGLLAALLIGLGVLFRRRRR